MWTCFCPGGRFALRSKIRTAFRIEVIISILEFLIFTTFLCDNRPIQNPIKCISLF
jgi:hypothetical protein